MNKEILKRYFDGQSSLWEKKQVMEYFEGEDMQVFDEYMLAQEESTPEAAATESYKANFYEELNARIHEIKSPVKAEPRRYIWLIMKIAASVLLFTFAGGVMYQYIKQESGKVSAVLTRVENKTKKLKRLEMKDGTKIWLNPGSTLTFNQHEFGDTVRLVRIEGEAYFNVAHDKTRPFRVNAGGVTTSVLGTTFNIEAYKNETDVRVMLVTGQVVVNAASKTNLLLPGQILAYSKSHKTMSVNSVDVSGIQEMIVSGKLVFENLPLTDVLKRIERVFSIKISADRSAILKDKQITGAYFRESPEIVLNRILFIHGLQYHKKGEHHYVITE